MKATITFANDWTQTLDDDLAQGGELAVDYDLNRLPAHRDTFRGAAVSDVLAQVRVHPDGQILVCPWEIEAKRVCGRGRCENRDPGSE